MSDRLSGRTFSKFQISSSDFQVSWELVADKLTMEPNIIGVSFAKGNIAAILCLR